MINLNLFVRVYIYILKYYIPVPQDSQFSSSSPRLTKTLLSWTFQGPGNRNIAAPTELNLNKQSQGGDSFIHMLAAGISDTTTQQPQVLVWKEPQSNLL